MGAITKIRKMKRRLIQHKTIDIGIFNMLRDIGGEEVSILKIGIYGTQSPM